MVLISLSPAVTMVPMAAYSAQIEQGSEHSMLIFTPQKTWLLVVLRHAATVDHLEMRFLMSSLAF